MDAPNRYKNSSVEQKASLNESTKLWRKNNPEKIKEIRRRTDEKRKIQRRDKRLRENFNLTYDQYVDKLQAQNFVCAICGEGETARDRAGDARQLAVDHCHRTGKIRGLLCSNCNLALGHFKDQKARLLSALVYLETYND